jgi:haloalkane dehalogenase
METIVRPATWDEWPAQARELFQAFRRAGEGEALILDQNLFIEALLPGSVLRTFTNDELNSYRAPYTQREHRRPILAWAREIPIDGEPPDVAARVNSYGAWLETSTPVPKLLLTFDPGTSMSPSVIDWCRAHIASLEVRHIGPGIHFVQEDHGPAIGAAIAAWRHKTRPNARATDDVVDHPRHIATGVVRHRSPSSISKIRNSREE